MRISLEQAIKGLEESRFHYSVVKVNGRYNVSNNSGKVLLSQVTGREVVNSYKLFLKNMEKLDRITAERIARAMNSTPCVDRVNELEARYS